MAKGRERKYTAQELHIINSHLMRMVRACESGLEAFKQADPLDQSGYVRQQREYFKAGIAHYRHAMAIAKQMTGEDADVVNTTVQ
jgi:hypothetical protein